jgi:nucleoside 2-deoxyribosyltransferase
MNYTEVISIVLSVITLSTLIFAVILYINNNQRKNRNTERETKAELSIMRERLERQIYELTERLHSDPKRWQDVNHLLINNLNKEKLKSSKQAFNFDFYNNLGINPNEIEINNNTVFFLTPFHNDFEKEYNTVKNICSKLDLQCTRGDEDFIKGSVLKYILNKIMSSSIIIANLNGRNPNVYYELGIAHSLGKPVILITNESNLKNIPFDLQSNKLILYNTKQELTNSLTNALARTFVENNKIINK